MAGGQIGLPGREPVSKHVVGLDGLIGHGQAVHIPQLQKDLTVVHREGAVKNHPAPQQGEAGQPQHDLAHPPQIPQPGPVHLGQLPAHLLRVAHLGGGPLLCLVLGQAGEDALKVQGLVLQVLLQLGADLSPVRPEADGPGGGVQPLAGGV